MITISTTCFYYIGSGDIADSRTRKSIYFPLEKTLSDARLFLCGKADGGMRFAFPPYGLSLRGEVRVMEIRLADLPGGDPLTELLGNNAKMVARSG